MYIKNELKLDYSKSYSYCIKKADEEFKEFMNTDKIITNYYLWFEKAERILKLIRRNVE